MLVIKPQVAEKTQGIGCGGIGAIHLRSQRIGLVDLLNEKVKVLKRHLPYHESDHVLNIAYNIVAGGVRLEQRQCMPHRIQESLSRIAFSVPPQHILATNSTFDQLIDIDNVTGGLNLGALP